MFNDLKELSGKKNILDLGENDTLRSGASINYDDPNEVANLMANHLSKIFVATHRKKMSEIIDNL